MSKRETEQVLRCFGEVDKLVERMKNRPAFEIPLLSIAARGQIVELEQRLEALREALGLPSVKRAGIAAENKAGMPAKT